MENPAQSIDRKRVLLIHTAFLGDVILVTPLIETLLSTGNIDLDVVVNPAAANILEHHPGLRKLWRYDKRGSDSGLKGLMRLAKKLREQKYNIVLSPHRSLRSAVLAYMTGAPVRIGFNTSAGRFLFNRKVTYLKDVHEIDRNLEFATALNIVSHKREPRVVSSKDDIALVNHLWEENNLEESGPVVALAPGSVWATKRWPDKYYARVARSLGQQGLVPILIGSAEDMQLCQSISDQAGVRLVNFAGHLTLTQTAALLSRCELLVSNDSAPMHLATAVKTPVMAIFGPTVKAFGFYPTGPRDQVVELELKCRPCGLHGGNSCPISTFECMLGIEPGVVTEKIFNLLEVYDRNKHHQD